MNFMHSSGVLHRDVLPTNILANADCKLKICDFGISRPLIHGTSMTPVAWTDYVATRWYRAPELLGCFYGRYSQAVDIWSIGCIFAEVLLGRPLFPGKDAACQLQLITDLLGKPPTDVIEGIGNLKARNFLHAMPDKPVRPLDRVLAPQPPGAPMLDPLAVSLLQQLLAFAPWARPTAAEALSHPYFAGLPKPASPKPSPSPSQISKNELEFEFELHKQSEGDMRSLIYAEILNYHPTVLAQFCNGMRTSAYAPPCVAADDVSRQFIILEQYGGRPSPQQQVGQFRKGKRREGWRGAAGYACIPAAP